MEKKHIPAAGQTLISGGHRTSGECPCHPVERPVWKKVAKSKRIVAIEFHHRTLESV